MIPSRAKCDCRARATKDAEIERLRAEREELLGALVDIMDGVDDERITAGKLRTSMGAKYARAVIAKAEGKG